MPMSPLVDGLHLSAILTDDNNVKAGRHNIAMSTEAVTRPPLEIYNDLK
jgi:hypothetical protein